MNYENLVLHDISRRLLDAYLANPTHALLISGIRGSGSGSVARSVAKQLVYHPTNIVLIEPDEKNTISIETVRELYVWTRDKKIQAQIVLIDGIDNMSHDAQHAFLKLLEEPNDLTRFVITAHDQSKLLPTILSRLQHIKLRPVSQTNSLKLIKQLTSDDMQKTKQLLFAASGLPAEITRLASDGDYFAIKSNLITDSRTLINGSSYEKLCVVPRYSSRIEAQELISTLSHIISFMIQKQPDDRLHDLAKITERVAKALQANGHVRTQLMYLAITS